MANKEVLLSVIIPVYNAQKTLNDTLASILQQTGLSFEIILVNDGSNDGSAELCEELAKRDEKIYVIHQQNAGSLRARLNGTKVSNGKYIMYVDADDFLYSGAFEHISRDLKDAADMYIYDYDMEEIGGKTTKTIKIMNKNSTTSFEGISKKDVAYAFMDGWMNTVCATVFSKELINEEPFLNIDEKLTDGEDRLQKMFTIITARKINYIPYSFYHYCWVAGSQGEKLRKGIFSEKLYTQFRERWSIERVHYADLNFNEEECAFYDLKKLNRICATFEKAYIDKAFSYMEFRELVQCLSEDQFFQELADIRVLKNARSHLKRSVKYIRNGRYKVLKSYWDFCRFIRKIKYGK